MIGIIIGTNRHNSVSRKVGVNYQNLLKSIQTQRITRSDILFTRDRYKKTGL